MATVRDVSDPYANHLVPVLPAGPGVCAVCHSSAAGNYERCFQCEQTVIALAAPAAATDFVALAVKHEQLAHELSSYKNAPVSDVRSRTRIGLAAVLWRWLSAHERCLATAAAVDGFPIVTTVPSTRGREDHPLNTMVRTVGWTSERFRPLLRATPSAGGGRDIGDDRFVPLRPIRKGVPILLIDDTWTTGAHAQSAASTLRSSGSGPVAVVVIGRHFNRDQADPGHRARAVDYCRRARARQWNWARCCLCARQ